MTVVQKRRFWLLISLLVLMVSVAFFDLAFSGLSFLIFGRFFCLHCLFLACRAFCSAFELVDLCVLDSLFSII